MRMTHQNHLLTRLAASSLFVLAFGTLFPAKSEAKLMFCNESGKSRSVAVGYKEDGKWISKGWWNVDDKKCVTPIKEDLKTTFYYYRATSSGGDFDGGNYFFCSTGKAFTIEGDENCKSRGYERSNFRELKLAPGTLGFRLTLNDKTIYQDGKKPAKAAPAKPQAKVKPKPDVQEKTGANTGPGAFGIPYTTTGIYRGCHELDGSTKCFFEVKNKPYVIARDKRSHIDVLNRMRDIGNGERFEFEGDILSQNNFFTEVTVRSMESLQDTPNEIMMNKLAGTWRSMDDPNSQLVFSTDFVRQEYYQGELSSQEIVDFTEVCADPQVLASDAKLLQLTGSGGPDDVLCYEIVQNTYDRLTLMYLPRGNFLEYKRQR